MVNNLLLNKKDLLCRQFTEIHTTITILYLGIYNLFYNFLLPRDKCGNLQAHVLVLLNGLFNGFICAQQSEP